MVRFLLVLLILLPVQASFAAGPSLEKGIKLIENKDFKGAILFFGQRVKENPDDPDASYYLGRAYLGTGDYETAIDYLEQAVDLKESVADYHFWLGQALGAKAQQVNPVRQALLAGDIRDEFEEAVKLNPNHIPALNGLVMFHLMAPGVMGGDKDKALQYAGTIKKLDERKGTLLLCQVYAKLGRIREADAEYKKAEAAFQDGTDNPGFFNVYGYYLLEQKRPAEAVIQFERQARLAPKDANSWDSLGDGYLALGKKKDALEAFEKALQINPGFKASKEKAEKLRKEVR